MSIVEIVILSEDSAAQAPGTIFYIIKKLFQLAVPGTNTQNIIQIPPEEKIVKEIVHANRWRSTNAADHQAQVALRRYIAREISIGRFLFFHVDGDLPWSKYHLCRIQSDFDKLIINYVKGLLPKKYDDDAMDIERALNRMILVVPFYSIEAWTYQNTTDLRILLSSKYSSHGLKKLDQWESDRRIFDEIIMIKNELKVMHKHNLELVKSHNYPTQIIVDIQKSLYNLLNIISSNDQLKNKLVSTYTTNAAD